MKGIYMWWECSSFQQISSFCAKIYHNKVLWILTESCKSDEILEWVVVFLYFFRFAILITVVKMVPVVCSGDEKITENPGHTTEVGKWWGLAWLQQTCWVWMNGSIASCCPWQRCSIKVDKNILPYIEMLNA